MERALKILIIHYITNAGFCQGSIFAQIKNKKGQKRNMICISKAEAKELRKLIPDVFIMRTVKQKSGNRGKCYTEESPKIISAIKKMRGE